MRQLFRLQVCYPSQCHPKTLLRRVLLFISNTATSNLYGFLTQTILSFQKNVAARWYLAYSVSLCVTQAIPFRKDGQTRYVGNMPRPLVAMPCFESPRGP